MKFSFEKAKNVFKKTAIITSAALIASSVPIKNKENKNTGDTSNHLLEKNINYNIKDFSGPGPQTINWNEAQKLEINKNEDKKLYEKIKSMEDILSKYSSGEPQIKNGSIAIISDFELEGKRDESKYETVDGVERTSPLDNRYITNLVQYYLVNDSSDLMILDRNPSSGSDIVDGLELEKEGYVKLPKEGYKHTLPEYYFILDQEGNDSTINFKFKVFSLKDKKILGEKSLIYNIPEEKSNFVDKVMSPDIAKNIKDFLFHLMSDKKN